MDIRQLAGQRSLRISEHEWALGLAVITAKRGTCIRRQVGCVLLDKDHFVLSTGFNGPPAGFPHCNEPRERGTLMAVGEDAMRMTFPNACPGAFAASGTQLDSCHAVHAEMNAMLRMGDPREVFACYCTVSPCITCTKLLLNTSCQQVWFLEPYAHDEPARALWEEKRGKTWFHFSPEFQDALERHKT